MATGKRRSTEAFVMAFHGFEFDPVNRVLLARVEGRLTETVLS
jgi:hypothetical protein